MSPSRIIAPLLLFAAPVFAQEIDSSYKDGVYRVEMNAWIDATPGQVWALLTDYEHLTRLDKRIVESHRLEGLPNGNWIVFTRTRGCVVLFCKTVERVEEVEEIQLEYIKAVVVPEKSRFSSGESEWFLEEQDGGTRLRYISMIEPNFKLPPLFGKRSMRKTMEKTALSLAESLEELADVVHIHEEDVSHP